MAGCKKMNVVKMKTDYPHDGICIHLLKKDRKKQVVNDGS